MVKWEDWKGNMGTRIRSWRRREKGEVYFGDDHWLSFLGWFKRNLLGKFPRRSPRNNNQLNFRKFARHDLVPTGTLASMVDSRISWSRHTCLLFSCSVSPLKSFERIALFTKSETRSIFSDMYSLKDWFRLAVTSFRCSNSLFLSQGFVDSSVKRNRRIQCN